MSLTFGPHVSVSIEAHVAVVTLDRPPYNHVSVEFVSHLAEALEAVDQREEIRCSVLQAAGKHFCAGADLVSAEGVGASGMRGVDLLYREAARLFAVRKPIVAAVQGGAIGAGLGLAVMADFRVASPEARFSANFVKLGFHPGFGLTRTLPRLIGQSKADLMCLTGRRVKPEDGLRWGLLDEVVTLQNLRPAALRLANEISENAPLAIMATRKTLRGDLAEAVRIQMETEYREQSSLRSTEDFKEGVRAVAERRRGRFSGR